MNEGTTWFDWLFRDRRTGRITIAQFPNLPLWIFLGATLLRWVLSSGTTPRTVAEVVAAASLGWWSVDEIARGVNPWRRILGTVVLIGLVVTVARAR